MDRGTRGALISPIVEELSALVAREERLRVYRDHIGENRQHLWSHFGDEPHRWNLLSAVDILIADSERGEALLVLEIEETGASPKKLLGDVFAVALGGHIAAGDLAYRVTCSTELWVCFPAKAEGSQRVRAEVLTNRIREMLGDLANPLRVSFIIVENRWDLVGGVCAAAKQWFERKFGTSPAH